MPLNSSGPISIGGSTSGQSINLELGRSATATSSLNESALRTLAGVASGAISLSNFYGKSAVTLSFANVNVYAGENGVSAEAGYQIQSNGYDYQNVNQNYSSNQQWITPTSAASDYEVYATVDAGTLSIGSAATGSWVAVSTNPQWIRRRPTVGISEVSMTIEIRKIGTTTILDSWAVTLTAERYT